MTKKILAVLLALAMTMSLFSFNVFAAGESVAPVELVVDTQAKVEVNGATADGPRYKLGVTLEAGETVTFIVSGSSNVSLGGYLAIGSSGVDTNANLIVRSAHEDTEEFTDLVFEKTASGAATHIQFKSRGNWQGADPKGDNVEAGTIEIKSIKMFRGTKTEYEAYLKSQEEPSVTYEESAISGAKVVDVNATISADNSAPTPVCWVVDPKAGGYGNVVIDDAFKTPYKANADAYIKLTLSVGGTVTAIGAYNGENVSKDNIKYVEKPTIITVNGEDSVTVYVPAKEVVDALGGTDNMWGIAITGTGTVKTFSLVNLKQSGDPEPEAQEIEVGFYVGTLNGSAPVSETVKITDKPKKYTIETNNITGSDGFGMIILKATAADTITPFKGLKIKTTEIKLNDTVIKPAAGNSMEYTIGADGKLEILYYTNKFQYAPETLNNVADAGSFQGSKDVKSASITFIVDPDNYEEEEPDTGKHPKGEEKLDLSEVEFPFNGPDRHVFPINPLEGGDTIKVHVVGSSESDFRFYLVGDSDVAGSNAVKASDLEFTTGEFDLTFDLTVTDGMAVKNLQVKGATYGASVTNLKFTHIGVVYPASEQTGDHPEGEKVVEITDTTVSKLGENVVDIADGAVTSSAEQFAIKIPEIANLNDKITVHIKGTTSGDFRMWAGHNDGALTMSPEPLWKASEKGVKFPTPDGEEFDVTYTLVVADKDGRGCKEADCVIFKGASYGANLDNLKITHFGYTIEKFVPEVPEPKGYVSDAALNVEPVADDDANALVVTPSEEVKTEGVLVAFADGAPDDGNIVVNYVDDTPKSPCGPNDIEVFFEPEGKSFPDCTMSWDFVGCGGLWGKTYASNAFNITIEKLKEVFGKEGATFTYAFTGTPGWSNGGVPSAVLNGKFDADSLPIETETKGNLTIGTFTLADLVKKSGVAVDAIENFVIQTSTDNFKLVYAYFTVPNEVVNPNAGKDAPAASTEPVEFKTGDKYVEISTDAKKVIDSIVITYNGKTVALDPSAIDYIKIKSEDSNRFTGVDGYAIQLGPDYHGFFFMGRLITMPHTFDENNTCTACDFVKPASEGDETVVDVPAKPDIITIDQGDACVIDIQSLGLKAGDTVHISIAGTVKTSVEAVRIFLTKEGVFNNNASDIVTATLDGNSFTFEGDLVAQGDIFYIYLKSQAGGPALHPNSFDFTVFTAEKV